MAAESSRRRYKKPVALEFDGDVGCRDVVLRAVALLPGLPPSRVAVSPVFRLQGQVRPVTLFERRGEDGVMLSMECPTPGATIYYDDTGAKPTVESKVYTEPIRRALALYSRAPHFQTPLPDYNQGAHTCFADPQAHRVGGHGLRGASGTDGLVDDDLSIA